MRYLAYFIALAVSYWVMTLADKQTNLTKKVGKILAWFMLALLLIGPVCKIVHRWHKCHAEGMGQTCPMKGHEGWKGDAKDGDKDEAKDDDDDSDDDGK